MLAPLRLLSIVADRLTVTSLSRKSAQVIPYAWSTIPIDADGHVDFEIALPSCRCSWLDRLPRFCGLFLVHCDQAVCESCRFPIMHLPSSVDCIRRLAQVGHHLQPNPQLVPHTRRTRQALELSGPIQVRLGKNVNIVKWSDGMKQREDVPNAARLIFIVTNVHVRIRSLHARSPADVIYSDGIQVEQIKEHKMAAYTSTLVDEPVIFSIAGEGALIDILPLAPALPVILYEMTTIALEGTSDIKTLDPIEFYPELRVRVAPGFRQAPMRRASFDFMRSSSSFIQPHRLRIAHSRQELFITIDHDPVLVFFQERHHYLHVYTGTNVYRLAVLLDTETHRLACFCKRETLDAIDDHDCVTLEQLTLLYGRLCLHVPIDMLMLIFSHGETSSDFQWVSVPMSKRADNDTAPPQ